MNVVTVQLSRVKGTQNGGKIKNLNDTNYFPCLTNFKLFSQIEGKSIHNCDVFKVCNFF